MMHNILIVLYNSGLTRLAIYRILPCHLVLSIAGVSRKLLCNLCLISPSCYAN